MRNVLFAVLLAVLLTMSIRADAYLCTAVPSSSPQLSQAWNQRCIPYFISNSGALLDGEARRQLVLQSFRVWTSEACTDLMFMDFGYTDQQPGFDPRRNDNQNIVVSVEDPLDARELFTRNELAITITSFNTATGEIFDADIMINNANFPFEDLSNTDECQGLPTDPPYDLRNTLVHEIGHFIGFEHDPDPSSTMFASAPECETKKRDLTQDNKLGVCTVYATGQPTQTCAAPETYDKGPGDPNDFRSQCEVQAARAACRAACDDEKVPETCRDDCNLRDVGGCGCISMKSERSPWWLVAIGLLWVVRRRPNGS